MKLKPALKALLALFSIMIICVIGAFSPSTLIYFGMFFVCFLLFFALYIIFDDIDNRE